MPIQCDRPSNVIQMVGSLYFARVPSFISLSLSSITFRLLFSRYSPSNRHGITLILTAEMSSISFFYSRRYVFCLAHCVQNTRWSHLLCRSVLFERGVQRGSCLSLRGMPFYSPVYFPVRWNCPENEFCKMESRSVLKRHGKEIQTVFLLLLLWLLYS